MSLRTRIILTVIFACGSVNLFLCFYFTSKIRETELSSLNARIEKSLYMMKLVNARPLYNVDKETLRVNMETFFDDENMKRISLSEDEIDINISFEREVGKQGVDIDKSVYIHYKGLKLGKMEVVYSTALIEQNLTRFRNQMLAVTFAVVALLIFVLVFLVNRLMRPVTVLTRAATEIAAGNLDKDIEVGGMGEVGDLSRNFAIMRDSVKDKINDLARTNENLEEQIFLKERNEERLVRQSRVISSVNTFFQKSMMAATYREIARIFIPIALNVIPCRYCFVGELSREDSSIMDILAFSDPVPADCSLKVDGAYQDGDEFRLCMVRVKEPVIANDPASHPIFSRIPAGHVPVESFLGMPMKVGSEITGLIAMAGKEGGFDADDLEACQMLAVALVEALSLKKKEDERAKLEEMMIQSEKMVSIGGLAAGMAHEINNPLAGILQNAQVIRNRLKEKLPANVKAAEELGLELDDLKIYMEKREIYKMIDSVMDAGKRAAAIVTNMLSFARKNTSGFMEEDMAELLDRTLELAGSDYNLKKKFDFKQIRIERAYDPNLPKVPCKASEIQQVFFNIFSNGAQAMVSGTTDPDPCFKLRVMGRGDRVRIEISDNGPGMKEETKKRVFEPFFTTKGVGEGTGLGLAVSYFIVTETHQGTIEVYSRPGRGTRFIIELPFKRNP